MLLGNPLLRRVASPVEALGRESILSIVEDLRDTLDDHRSRHGSGRGIAAPQISSPMRIVYVGHGDLGAMLNPEIVESSAEMMTLWDDCFSLPGLMVKVKRHKSVTVRYSDLRLEARSISFEGSMSELLQHEIDHLDGILTIDRAVDSRHILLKSEYEKMRSENISVQHPF